MDFIRPILLVLRHQQRALHSAKHVPPPPSRLLSTLKTLHLFTASDLKTMLTPLLTFSLLSALAGPPLTSHALPLPTILSNTPPLIAWLWINILILSIANQRAPEAVLEDSLNKPWRPIASGRITPDAARQIQLFVVPLLLAYSSWLGVLTETLECLVGSWVYNELGGADEHFVVRNVVNGVAYLAYGAAGLKIIAGTSVTGEGMVQPAFYSWLFVVALVVGSTIQVQDLKDLEGDGARGRHTMPVVLGAGATRGSVCLGVLVWSVVCPVYWGVDGWAMVAFVMAGLVLSARVVLCRSAKADRTSFVMWSWWVMGMFALPLLGRDSAGAL